MADTTFVEFVEFKAKGLDTLTERTAEYSKQVGEAQKRNARLAADLRSGVYAQHAAQLRSINLQYEKMKQAGNLQVLVAEHGRFGGVLRNNAADFRKLGLAAGIGLGAAVGMTGALIRSGLQGTVEGYRLELAWTRLSRQVAGIALPAIEKLTDALGWVTNKFQSLSGGQQNAILNVGLFAVGTLAAASALKSLIVVGQAAVSIYKALGLASLFAAGAQAAGAATTVTVGTATVTGAAGGGLRALGAGAPIALSSGAQLLLGGGGSAAAGAAGGAAAGGLSRLAGFGSTALRFAPPVAAATAVADAATGGYYDIQRRKGNSMVTSGVAALGGGFLNLLSQPLALFGEKTFGEHYREKAEKEGFRDKPGEGHKDVTPLGGEFRDVGESFFTLQSEILKQTAASGGATNADIVDAIKENTTFMERLTESIERSATGMPRIQPAPGFFDYPRS